MKYIFLVILLSSNIALAHPGAVDENGGHRCYTDCEEYGLKYYQYHHHLTAPRSELPQETQEHQTLKQPETPKKSQKVKKEVNWVWVLMIPIAIVSLIIVTLWELKNLAVSLVKKIRGKNGSNI